MGMDQVERQDRFFSRFRALPVRRPRVQSAALAAKSIVQDGLVSVAKDCTIRMCKLIRGATRANISAQWSAPRRQACGGLVPWYRCAGRVDGPCSGHTDSICDSEPDTGSGTSTWLEATARASTSAYCTVAATVLSARTHPCSLSVSASMVSPRKSRTLSATGSWVPREPKASSLFTSLPSRRAKQKSVHSSGTSHAVCILCSPAAGSGISNSPLMSAPNPGKWTLRSGAGVHGTWAPRSNATSLRPQSFPIPARQRPLAWAGSSRMPVAQRDRRRRDGYQVQWRECFTEQSTRFTPNPHHIVVPHHVNDHLTFELFHSPISLKTFRPSSSSAVRHGSTPGPPH